MTAVTRFDEIVSAFGAAAKAKLAGPGDREAAIRSPIERLVTDVAAELGLTAVPYDEVRDTDRAVRPDYAIAVDGAITGYIEVKKPGASIDPDTFTGHDERQWERQRDLPNLASERPDSAVAVWHQAQNALFSCHSSRASFTSIATSEATFAAISSGRTGRLRGRSSPPAPASQAVSA